MRVDAVIEVLHNLGCSKIRVRSDTVDASCPFARWRHPKGQDRHPSFSVKASDAGNSYYHCFSCGSKGLVGGMLRDLQRLGATVSEAILETVRQEERENSSKLNLSYPDMFGPSLEAKLRRKEHAIWDESELTPFAGRVPKYILNRGVSIETCKAWEIGYDDKNKRVVFPIRQTDGKLVGAMSRAIHSDGSPRYMPVFPFTKSLYLYGEHIAKRDCLPVSGGEDLPARKGIVLVEGMMDSIRMYEHGYKENVLGLMKASLSDSQTRTILLLNRPVFMMLDWDMAGIRGRRMCVEKLYGKVQLFDVPGITKCKCGSRWPVVIQSSGVDELRCGKCKELWVVDTAKKDPDQLTREEAIYCLSSAKREVRS